MKILQQHKEQSKTVQYRKAIHLTATERKQVTEYLKEFDTELVSDKTFSLYNYMWARDKYDNWFMKPQQEQQNNDALKAIQGCK